MTITFKRGGAELEVHPACALFPMIEGKALEELAADIAENGLIEPIVVYDGAILDGRNRLRACDLADVPPEFREWQGEPSEIVAWIASKNIHRRHLETGQRAMIAARLADLRVGANQTHEGLPIGRAAEMLGVGVRTAHRAREVIESGNEELIEAVARGEVSVSAAAASLKLAPSRPIDGEVVRATLACLDHAHRGTALLPELRTSVEAQLGCALEEADWRNAIARGASQRLWEHTGKISAGELLGHIESRTKRPVTAPPAADSPIPRSAPISTSGDPEPGGDREDGEQDPDEGPVLPSDPDDPAVQGHMAAEEEGVWVDPDVEGDEDTDTNADTTTNDEGADATPVTAAEAPYPKGTIGYAQDGIAKWLGLLGARSYAKRIEIDTIRRSYEREEGKLSDRAFAQAVRMGEGERWEASGAYIWLVDSSGDEEAQAAMKAASVPPSKPPKPRPSAMPPDELPVPPPAPRDLPDDHRAELDAYYTPDLHARALVRWLAANVYAGQDPQRILEPSVGGGAWLRACRDEWPEAHLRALDIDPAAPGLKLADRPEVGDFLTADLISADLIVGNPPYGGDLVAWIDRSRELAPVVGYLLRSTFLGAMDRLEWWQRRPPTDVIVVLPRPAWEGPGKRATTDRVDSLFVVWRGPVAGATRLHWLDAKEGA